MATTYFVTGGTGFIGRFLIRELAAKECDIYVLVRSGSRQKFARLVDACDSLPGRLIPVTGDITRRSVLSAKKDRELLIRSVDQVFHLAAIYDMSVDSDTARTMNVDGTEHVIQLANDMKKCTCLHHVSSIAVAGDFKGVFDETMFDEGQKLKHPYFATKFESEQLVRTTAKTPWRIYRPGVVVGSSQTGEMDKIDGPYYFFKLIQNIRGVLPQWMPLVGIEGGPLQMVPVDYVAAAIARIASQPGLDGKAFHLVDREARSIGDVTNEFCRAAHAPELAMRIDSRMFNVIPPGIRMVAGQLPMVRDFRDTIADSIGVPPQLLGSMNLRATFSDANTAAALDGSDIECPALPDYAWKLWDYWERHLDPDLHRSQSLESSVAGRNVLVTGASSGIGRAVALQLGAAGANVLLVARSRAPLSKVRKEIEAAGGTAHVYTCDLSDLEQIDAVAQRIQKKHGPVDVLVNNAGRSIRRTIEESTNRFHDFERTMQLNYFGSLRLTLALLPAMRARRRGHIINISSIGVQTNAPRFSAYVASKAALDAFSRCIAAEVFADNVAITTVFMPLVRTPMIAPTKIYNLFPALTPEQAAEMVMSAIIKRPKRVATRLGTFVEALYAISPTSVDFFQNVGYRLFPASKPGEETELPMESVAFAHLMRGVHW